MDLDTCTIAVFCVIGEAVPQASRPIRQRAS
jgi:hypothetical protein